MKKNKKVLDLINLDANLTKKINIIAENVKGEYTKIIDEISIQFSGDINWWCTSLSARDTTTFNVFFNFCILKLALDELEIFDYSQIVVKDKVLKKILLKYTDVPIKVKKPIKKRIKESLLIIRSQYVLYNLKRRIEIIRSYNSPVYCDEAVSLVDTYTIPNQFSEKGFFDRYFDGFIDYSEKKIKFFSQSDFSNNFEGEQLSKKLSELSNFICLEGFVEKSDYKKIKEFILFCKRTKIEQADGIIFIELFQQALKDDCANLNSLYAVLKSCILERMIEKYNYKIENIVTWYEGQASSNSLIKIANEHGINTIAYVYSPMPENSLGLRPSKIQVKEKVAAKKYAIQGSAWKEEVCQFCNVDIINAPSFRYRYIFEKKEEIVKGEEILVVMPGITEEASAFLKSISYACCELKLKKIFIKNHPFLQDFKLKNYGLSNDLFGNCDIEFVKGTLNDALDLVKLAIISGSSSTLEILLHGVNVVNYVQPGALLFTSVPDKFKCNIEIAYSSEDIVNSIVKLKNKSINKIEIDEIRDSVFTPVNKESVLNFENSW